jgi:3-hydroxyisobutyrate dehydrogenase
MSVLSDATGCAAGCTPSGVVASTVDGFPAYSGGAAGGWAMTNLAPRALADNFAPGFYVKHIIKDMKIALDSAAALKLDLPGLANAKRLYEQVAVKGWEDCGTQALYRLYTAL